MSKRIHHKQLISFLLMLLCAVMAANTAFAAEAVNLGGDGKNTLVYGTTLSDGRILLVGSRTAPGQYFGSGRLVCLNRDGSESWQYIDDVLDDGRFSYAAELEDGTIGLVFWKLGEDGKKSGYSLRFFTTDGKPTGKEVIIPGDGYDELFIQNATKSRLQLLYMTIIQEATDTQHRTVYFDNYLIDWEGNEIAQLDPFEVHSGFCNMIEEDDGLVMTGHNPEDPQFRASIRKTDLQGNVLWETFLTQAWPDTSYADPEQIIRTDDGGYIILQQERISTNWEEKRDRGIIEYRSALVKLDSEGKILWTSTEGFENNTDWCMGLAMTGGKIAVSFLSYNRGSESYRVDNPRKIAWFDEDGKPLGTVELEIDLENFKPLRRSMGTTIGKNLIPQFYEDRMIPMEDGLWMSASLILREVENGVQVLEMKYTGLFKIPEP